MEIEIKALTPDLEEAYLDFFDHRAFSDGSPYYPCYCNAFNLSRDGIRKLSDLAEAARKVVAVEIDKSLLPILDHTLADWDNVRVINADILKTDLQAIANEENGGQPLKVIANLPYYITTPITM